MKATQETNARRRATARTTRSASTGSEVRARVVGEGGNLGFTQRGRIEYAMGGGRINTDFIDNSAGVDTSDHEVNLEDPAGPRDPARRAHAGGAQRAAGGRAPPTSCDHVLYDNYLQAQILSQEL